MASTSTSEAVAYVWAWLPGASEPVVAGVLAATGDDDTLMFRYGNGYLAREDRMSLYGPALPLDATWHRPVGTLALPGPLRDAAPDAWGRRVILNRVTGRRGRDAETADLAELDYLLGSGSNRLGAVDFQRGLQFEPRADSGTLAQLLSAAELVEAGEPIPDDLARAVMNGTSIGGARPKATLHDEDGEWIAKFSTADDPWSVVGAEYASIVLAERAGIDVPEARLVRVMGKNVLLTRRFDRPGDGTRRAVVSALTILGLDELSSRYATYPDLLAELRKTAIDAAGLGATLFRRIAFNMAISNTDDHARNHAAFWDGSNTTLTPAYDLSPCRRAGHTASQAMAYGKDGRKESAFGSLVDVSSEYALTGRQGREIIAEVRAAIEDGWIDAAEAAELSTVDRRALRRNQFLNPGTVEGFVE